MMYLGQIKTLFILVLLGVMNVMEIQQRHYCRFLVVIPLLSSAKKGNILKYTVYTVRYLSSLDKQVKQFYL